MIGYRKFLLRAALMLTLLCSAAYAHAQVYDVLWTDLSGVTYDVPNNTLTKTAANGWSDGAARSTNFLEVKVDGYVKYTAHSSDRTTDKVIGLSAINATTGYTDIDNAYMITKGKVSVWKSGVLYGLVAYLKANDELTIERSGSNI